MPSLKSSTKGTDTITLFATERRALKSARSALFWLAGKCTQADRKERYEDTAKGISEVLESYPEQDKTPKAGAK